MPRVLLVYPKFPETFWGYQRALKFLGLRATHPPLGLLTVAGLLPRDYEVRLIDLNVANLTGEDCGWADIVLTGGMMIQRPSVEWIAGECARAGVPVVIGGPDATSSSQDLPETAHLVLGEAESPRFAEAVTGMMAAEERVVLDLRHEPTGFDESPLPRYDLLDPKAYASMAIQVSRGCPFKCEFCDIPTLFGDKTRYKSVDAMLAELDVLLDRGWRGNVFWVDDNFIGNKKACKEILPPVIDWQRRRGMPFDFYTQASVNLAGDAVLLDLMKRAGFTSVFLGIETPIEESLRETKKLQNVRFDLLESVRTIQRAGMEVMAGFIIGFDNDPEDIDRHLVRFIQDSGIPVAMTGLLTAIPGSPLYDRLEEEGRLLATDAERGGNNTFEFGFNFETRQDPAALIHAYKNVLQEVYGKPEQYFRRVETLLENLPAGAMFRSRLTWRRVRALLRSLLMIPGSAYGRTYGRFLLRTLFRDPARLGFAVRQGIVGVHFHQMARDRLVAHEYDSFVNAAIERVRKAYTTDWHEGLEAAGQILADARERLRKVPVRVRKETRALYAELAAHEFDSFVTSAVERVREAYSAGRQEGLELANQVLTGGRERLRRVPVKVRKEMRALYEELDRSLKRLAAPWEPA